MKIAFTKSNKLVLSLSFFIAITSTGYAQTYIPVQINQPASLEANAGLDSEICVGNSISIGGLPSPASNGTAPYTYSWTPATGLSNATIANPMASPTATANYFLTVTDSKGCTHTDSVTVTVNPCTGIAENQNVLAMHIFPNPNNGTFTLSIEVQREIKQLNIEVMNAYGQLIYQERVDGVKMKYEKQLDISTYAKGMYFVRIQENENYVINKVFIN